MYPAKMATVDPRAIHPTTAMAALPSNPVKKGPMFVVEFPSELRNDLFYCQRALGQHIKIHQVDKLSVRMVVNDGLTYC